MGITQYKVGKKWEETLLDYYSNRGFFAYKFPTEYKGTICDIIVSKNGSCMFIEAKHITGKKLYYKGCGIYKKKDEINRFVEKTNNNVYIMIKSDKLGVYWTTWVRAKDIFEKKGYLDLETDCFCANRGEIDG